MYIEFWWRWTVRMSQDLSRDMTKPTKWVCVQRRFRSAWASAQSDQSSLSAWRKLGSLATHWAHSEDSDQTGRMPWLIWVFAGCTVTLLVLSCCSSFVLSMLISTRHNFGHTMPDCVIVAFYAQNFENIGGAYCFWLVHQCVCHAFYAFELCMLRSWNFIYMDSSWKNSWPIYFFLFELCPFLELCPF